MSEFLSELFTKTFGSQIELATILISMIPIIELRGAIPFATNTNFWKTNALTNWEALFFGLIGSSFVVPIIALIFLPLINMLRKTKVFKKLAFVIENKIKHEAQSISKKSPDHTSCLKKMLNVFIFVAVPLPLTGVWTGTCVSIMLGLKYWQTCLAVIAGNICAGLIIALILKFFPWINNYLFFIFIGIVLIVFIFSVLLKPKKEQRK